MTSFKILETHRLTLRKLELPDSNWLFEILGDPDTMRFYPRPYSKEEVERIIERMLESYQMNGFGLWAIELKNEDTCIGQCGITLQNIDGEILPEIGYHLHHKYQNNGYATEAALACLSHGLQKLELPYIYIHTYTKNTPSIRVALRLGMKKVKQYNKAIPYADTSMTHVIYRTNKLPQNHKMG